MGAMAPSCRGSRALLAAGSSSTRCALPCRCRPAGRRLAGSSSAPGRPCCCCCAAACSAGCAAKCAAELVAGFELHAARLLPPTVIVVALLQERGDKDSVEMQGSSRSGSIKVRSSDCREQQQGVPSDASTT